MFADEERVPLSALNHFVFCPRRCALIHIEGQYTENVYTVEGRLSHRIADEPSEEQVAGVRIVHALPLYSARLGLVGKADIVEFRGNTPYPVDYKRGRRRQWHNDDVQLCAQALCLEEMTGESVPAGAIYHVRSRRRREVEFTAHLRDATEGTVMELHEFLRAGQTPKAHPHRKCKGCSLRSICVPDIARIRVGMLVDLFEPEEE